MTPRIENLTEKKLIGKRISMSLANNKTGELWQNFMPKRRIISNNVSNDLISLQVYKPTHFSDFKPDNEFEKWATVEVTNFDVVPVDMETFSLEGGLFAVFDYKGSGSDPSIFQYIFRTWLPDSDYMLDTRPHFEVLGDKYKNNDPSSEEEIWIPIKPKQ
jgi:AraC family transcriptional regulator